ncbi:Arylsulfotransferase-domain-containing protein [Xylaria nigripes]|nr:Arylsulfotransferase-domain-containing protein [Xylaria nigripes]
MVRNAAAVSALGPDNTLFSYIQRSKSRLLGSRFSPTIPSFWLLFSVLGHCGLASASAAFSPDTLYETGFYGLYPTESFKSFALTSPRLHFTHRDESQCNDGYYMLAPKGKLVSNPGPTIYDAQGDLIWADDSFGVVFDFQTQRYKNETYLTLWASPVGSVHGYGRGTYYMLDSSYQLVRKFEPPAETLKADLHDLRITERGTALMTAYSPVPADLTSIGGPKKGWALDSLVQEIDIETGELVFKWNALSNLALNDTIRYFAGEDDGTTPEKAFDFFHVNSIELDPEGNYIISGRHTSTIVCISPKGEKLWTLGGKRNDFTDLSDGLATDFAYQHHARLHANYTLSIFDNAVAERAGALSRHGYTRGLLVQLDTVNMTATLIQEFYDPQSLKEATSQGSMQVMSNGHVVLGYGWLPYITEFSADGAVLCDVEIAPWIAARWGLVTTYRALKTEGWVGKPLNPPAIYISPSDGAAFVSWNGATEVRSWVLQGASYDALERDGEAAFVDVDVVPKSGFETSVKFRGDVPQFVRVAAVNERGEVLGHSQMVDRYVGNAGEGWGFYMVVFVILVTSVAGLVLMRRRGRRALSARGIDLLEQAMSVVRNRIMGRAKFGSGGEGFRGDERTAVFV